MNKPRTECIISASSSLTCCWSAVPIPRLMLDLGSGAACEDLAQSPRSLMRAFKAGIFTTGKTPHAEAARTLWWCQTSRKTIRAVPVSGGEPRGHSQQRGLPAVCAEVVRFWKQLRWVQDRAGLTCTVLTVPPPTAGRGRKAAFQNLPNYYQHRWLWHTTCRLSTSQYLPEMDAKGLKFAHISWGVTAVSLLESTCVARHSSSTKGSPVWSRWGGEKLCV